jgi:hypothetical protein
MKIIAEVGDIVTVKCFSYINTSGGTGISDETFNKERNYKYPTAKVKIVKRWYDYEAGDRFWAISVDGELDKYLKKYASKKINKNPWKSEELIEEMNKYDFLVSFSESSIVKMGEFNV